MHTRYPTCTRVLSGTLALMFGLVVVVPPAMAGEPVLSASTPEKTSLAAAVAAKVEILDTAEAVLPPEPQASSDDKGSPAFFKSPKGVAILLLFLGGTTAVIVSKDRDRVHSQIR